MNNDFQKYSHQLRNQVDDLMGLVQKGITWTGHHLNGGESQSSAYRLKHCRRNLKRVRSLLGTNPAVAFFGASQMGKSYMVKNLLSDEKGVLMIEDHREGRPNVDFLSQINPEGKGTEATAAVTRFGSFPVSDPSRLPVEVLMLSATDLILLLCDSYYLDFDARRALPSKAEVFSHLESVTNDLPELQTQPYLDEDDVFSIKDYLEANAHVNLDFWGRLRDLKFWHKLAAVISRMDPLRWKEAFEVLWNYNPDISQIFSHLLDSLLHLRFPKSVFVELDVVGRRDDENSILNVSTLQKFMSKESEVEIQMLDRTMSRIQPGILCALTKEIRLNVSKNSVAHRPFIQRTDILDFPGARSRKGLTEPAMGKRLPKVQLPELLLRGKVSYLFQAYSYTDQISNLCICTSATRQHNVKEIPGLIRDWIFNNIGKTPEQRTELLKSTRIPPLFIVFTFWNEQLEEDEGGNFEQRLKKTFVTRFKEDIKKDANWPEEWELDSSSQILPFQNYYLLRDFKYSQNIFPQLNGPESEADGKQANFLKAAQGFFEKSDLVARFFQKPGKTWKETSIPNMDGSALIIKKLEKAVTAKQQLARFLQLIRQTKKSLYQELKRHHHSEESEENIRKAVEAAGEIHAVMNIYLETGKMYGSRFGSFWERFFVSNQEVYTLFFDLLRQSRSEISPEDEKRYSMILATSHRISKSKTFDENVAILQEDYHKLSPESLIRFFESHNVDLKLLFYGRAVGMENQSDILAEGAKGLWQETKLDISNFQDFISEGFPVEQLEYLLQNLKRSFERQRIAAHIATQIRDYVDRYSRIEAAEEMVAHLASGIINQFVESFGWSFHSNREKSDLLDSLRANPVVQIDDSMISRESVSISRDHLENLFDTIQAVNEVSWRQGSISPKVVQNIPMARNFRRWLDMMRLAFLANCNIPTYDMEANRVLGELLSEIGKWKIAEQFEVKQVNGE